jgi:hypothetical protein
MATLTRSTPMRQARTGYPAASLRFDWIAAALSILLLTGVNIDIWAHNHNMVDESFFTPWHGLMYGAFLLFAAFLTFNAVSNIRQGYGLTNALPRGYNLSLLGTLVFAAGGVGDMVWHSVFGIEQNNEALLSPSHLTLALGFFLLFSGTIRAAWFRAESHTINRWVQLFPALVGTIGCATLFMMFTQFANSTYNGAFSTVDWTGRRGTEWVTTSLGVSSIVLHTAIMMGALLFLVRRWRLPFGAATLVIFVPGLYISTYQDTYILLPGMLVAGLIADVLLLRLRPNATRTLQTAAFGFVVPVVYYAAFFAALEIADNIGWRIHSWAGAIVFAGVTGLLLAILMNLPNTPVSEEKPKHTTS